MATTEERMKILKMIEEGKLSAEEGAKLLSALSAAQSKAVASAAGELGVGNARWLRVRVTDVASGRSKATVQIPISLIDAGMKIGAHFAPEIDGVELDEVIAALRSGMTGKIIDVTDDEDGEHVEIFVE
jgi:hypothetical protein